MLAIALDSVLALDFSVKCRSGRRRYHIFDELRYEFFENWQKWTKLNGKKMMIQAFMEETVTKNTLYYEFWLFYNYTSWYEHSSYYELESKYQKNHKRIGCKKNHYLRMVQFSKKIYKNNFGTQNFSTRPNLKFTHLLNFCDLVFSIISCMINFDHGLWHDLYWIVLGISRWCEHRAPLRVLIV